LVFLTWAVFSAITIAIVHFLPTVYRAEAVILVESQRIPERFVAPTVSTELKDRLSTLSQQILSYSKLLEVIERFDLYRAERANHTQEEIVEMMRADVNIQLEQGWATRIHTDGRPSAFRISYQCPNPELAALVANQLGGLFIDENLKSREVQAMGTSEFLGTQLAESKKRLEEQEARLSAYKLKFNGELPEQENLLLATLGQLQIRLQAANDTLMRAEQTKAVLEASSWRPDDAERSATADTASGGGENAVPVGAVQEPEPNTIQSLRRRIAAAKDVWGDNYPEMVALRQTLALREAEESGARRETSSKKETTPASASSLPSATPRQRQVVQSTTQRQERLNAMRAQANLVANQIASAIAERERITKEIARVQQRLGRIPIREQEMIVVKRDYEISRAHYQSLLDKGMSADLAVQMELRQKAERFTVIDVARVPQKPEKPNRPALYAIATMLSCAVGIAVGFGREAQRNTLLGDWDIPKGVPVLGRIPSIVTYNPILLVPAAKRRRRRWAAVALLILVAGAAAAAWFLGWVPQSLTVRLHG